MVLALFPQDWIDRKWMSMYQKLPEMAIEATAPSAVAHASGPAALETGAQCTPLSLS